MRVFFRVAADLKILPEYKLSILELVAGRAG